MILTKPSSITKNSPATFTINKADLALHPKVVASLLSNPDSWSKIVLAYKSSIGNDIEKVVFDATEATPTKEFFVSEFAQDTFEIQSITIFNMDNGFVVIPRSDLTASEFDVGTVPPPVVILTGDFTTGSRPSGWTYGVSDVYAGGKLGLSGYGQLGYTIGSPLIKANTDYKVRVYPLTATGSNNSSSISFVVGGVTSQSITYQTNLVPCIGSYFETSVIRTNVTTSGWDFLMSLSYASGGDTLYFSRVELLEL